MRRAPAIRQWFGEREGGRAGRSRRGPRVREGARRRWDGPRLWGGRRQGGRCCGGLQVDTHSCLPRKPQGTHLAVADGWQHQPGKGTARRPHSAPTPPVTGPRSTQSRAPRDKTCDRILTVSESGGCLDLTNHNPMSAQHFPVAEVGRQDRVDRARAAAVELTRHHAWRRGMGAATCSPRAVLLTRRCCAARCL